MLGSALTAYAAGTGTGTTWSAPLWTTGHRNTSWPTAEPPAAARCDSKIVQHRQGRAATARPCPFYAERTGGINHAKSDQQYWPVFVLPTLLAFIIGFIWPFIWGVYLSFQRFTTVSKTTFVGFDNYIKVFQDTTFTHAFWFTAAFTVVSTVLINVFAFAIALALTPRQSGAQTCSAPSTSCPT